MPSMVAKVTCRMVDMLPRKIFKIAKPILLTASIVLLFYK